MTTTKKTIQDPDLARVEAALQRAAKKARKTAKDTRTPLIIYKDGKIRRYILTTAVSTGLLMTRSNCELNLRQRPSWIFRKESFKAKLNSHGHTSWILKMKQTLLNKEGSPSEIGRYTLASLRVKQMKSLRQRKGLSGWEPEAKMHCIWHALSQ